MACSNNRYRKSSAVAINSASQAFVAAGTTLQPGSAVSVTGCSLSVANSGIQVNSDGLYQIEAAVTFTPSAAGVAIVQIYKDGVLLPCTTRQLTVAADSVYTISTCAPGDLRRFLCYGSAGVYYPDQWCRRHSQLHLHERS